MTSILYITVLNFWIVNILSEDYKQCVHHSWLFVNVRRVAGENAVKEVCRLLATLIVLVLVLGWTRSTFVGASLTSLLRSIVTGEHHHGDRYYCLPKAASYVLDVDTRRPLVYSTLQLGRSWADVVLGFLGEPDLTNIVWGRQHLIRPNARIEQ